MWRSAPLPGSFLSTVSVSEKTWPNGFPKKEREVMITHFLYVFQYVEENEMEVIMVRSFAVHGKIFKERFFFQTLRSIAIKSSSSSTQYLSEENVWLWIALGENRNVPMFPCRWEEQKPFFLQIYMKTLQLPLHFELYGSVVFRAVPMLWNSVIFFGNISTFLL